MPLWSKSCRLSFEALIRVRIPGRSNDDVGAEVRRLVTGIARAGQRIERSFESSFVVRLDRAANPSVNSSTS
jgi:hypothetical protein